MPYVSTFNVTRLKELRNEAIKHARSFGEKDRRNPYYLKAVAYNDALRVLELDLSLSSRSIEQELEID